LPEAVGRLRAVPAAILTAVLLASIVPAVTNSATPPAGLEPFLYALGQVESGGSYTARNATSGAYGKYQIIPSSWAAWARQYLGSSTAPKTPANQEIVAHRKVTALYVWLDSWPVVAHWWLTGSSERNPALWSSFSRTYVTRVMTIMKTGRSAAGTPPRSSSTSWLDSKDTRIGETAAAIVYRGSWSTARFSGYSARQVKYATKTGAAAILTFTGKGIAWIGPTGPTRGTARVYIDGKFVKAVDLRRSRFHARVLLFARAFPAGGSHTIKIAVSSSGRPVAIDELVVGT
jgi:transglycosylase-like protein